MNEWRVEVVWDAINDVWKDAVEKLFEMDCVEREGIPFYLPFKDPEENEDRRHKTEHVRDRLTS